LRRGEIWTAAGGPDYAGKPRPVAIVQSDRFDGTKSITICLLTTDPTEAPLIRIRIDPTAMNGLGQPSSIMVDKLSTIPKAKLASRIGRLSDSDLVRLDRALTVFLGIAE